MLTAPNGRSYIGVSVDPKRRWSTHKTAASNGSHLAIHRAIRKYGADNFKHQIVFEARGKNSQAICFRAEKTLVKFHETLHPTGYNLLEGGNTASGYSLETSKRHREKIINALADPAVRKKMSEKATAHFSDPLARQRTSNSTKAYFEKNPEARVAMSELKRATVTKEHQQKMTAAAVLAMKRPKEAQRRSESAKKTLMRPDVISARRAALARPVVCIETGQHFEAINDAVRWLQSIGMLLAQNTHISRVASGKEKKAYGYTWAYQTKS